MGDKVNEVNKRNFRKWIKFLRSGKYKRGRTQLYENGKYCCLGVACEAAGIVRVANRYDGERCFLPKSVKVWLGIDTDDVIIGDNKASQLNDYYDWSFRKIADAIEKEYLGVGDKR